MTHRDRLGDPPGRRGAAGDVGPPSPRWRQGFPTHSGGSLRRPERRPPPILWTGAFGPPNACVRGPRLAVLGTATPRAPNREPWVAVSMSHYQRSLV